MKHSKENSVKPDNQKSIFRIKLSRWEYWPFWAVYWPFVPYWVWLSLRSKSFFFFTAANPEIEFGGMLGEAKDKIYDLIPDEFLPKTIRFEPNISSSELLETLNSNGIIFPFILKPNIGNRGWMVEKISSKIELEYYLTEIKVPFLAQEFIDYSLELGVFYHRLPNEKKGVVSSVVMKELLHVVGDGKSTVAQLMTDSSRAKMHLETISEKDPILVNYIPEKGEKKLIVPIGNHCRGTKFLNANHLITDQLTQTFDHISKQIDGFYFGRFDLRCSSIEDLYQGKNIKIMELNGSGAEPAHIYHPGRSLWKGYRDIKYHLDRLCDISIANKKEGVSYYSTWQGLKALLEVRSYNRSFRKN
ncbi:ATP-grasp domain-containing protein [Reichenbachiella versicolor]|uniref:hypothetical protein n=1 Tax=Reichenbachiella versicolor TaxID=1821036 RepID=UPI0013A57E53|nr:hypothetical protein [Reichenbachiella versicolor]